MRESQWFPRGLLVPPPPPHSLVRFVLVARLSQGFARVVGAVITLQTANRVRCVVAKNVSGGGEGVKEFGARWLFCCEQVTTESHVL